MRNTKKRILLLQNCGRKVNDLLVSKISFLTRLLLEETDSVETIILEGSLGKGEGTLWRQGSRSMLLSDCDFVVVTSRPLVPPVKTCKIRNVERLLGSPSNVLTIWKPLLRFVPEKITWYDVKFGSQILYGNEQVLDLIPLHLSDHIPLEEGIRLLFNRILDLLTALDLSFPLEERNTRRIRLAYACNKARMAFGECLLLLKNKWNPHASVRNEILEKETFSESKRWTGLLSAIRDAVNKATLAKLNISQESMNDAEIWAFWFETQKLFNYFLKYYLEEWKGERIYSDEDLIDFMFSNSLPFRPCGKALARLRFVLASLPLMQRKAFAFRRKQMWFCLVVAYLLYTSVQAGSHFSLDKGRITIAEGILKSCSVRKAKSNPSCDRWESAKAVLLEVAEMIRQ